MKTRRTSSTGYDTRNISGDANEVRARLARVAGRTTWVRRPPMKVRRPTQRIVRRRSGSATRAKAFRRHTSTSVRDRNGLGRRTERIVGPTTHRVRPTKATEGPAIAFVRPLCGLVRAATLVVSRRTRMGRVRTQGGRLHMRVTGRARCLGGWRNAFVRREVGSGRRRGSLVRRAKSVAGPAVGPRRRASLTARGVSDVARPWGALPRSLQRQARRRATLRTRRAVRARP